MTGDMPPSAMATAGRRTRQARDEANVFGLSTRVGAPTCDELCGWSGVRRSLLLPKLTSWAF